MESRTYKKHTLLRRREAKKNNFLALDLEGKFKMIKRQKLGSDSYQLFQRLANDEQLAFIAKYYKGFTVQWKYQERQALIFGGTPKIKHLGWALKVYPLIGKVRYEVKLLDINAQLKPENLLKIIQKHMPTVRAL